MTDPELALVIGTNARAVRRQRGRLLHQVAADADISESMLSKVENGHVYPSVLVLNRLARALNVGVEVLFVDLSAAGAHA